MGKTRTVKFALHRKVASGHHYTPVEWRVKNRMSHGPGHGKPTPDNIRKYVEAFELSTRTGVNRHLGPETVLSAHIVNQQTGEIVARWERT